MKNYIAPIILIILGFSILIRAVAIQYTPEGSPGVDLQSLILGIPLLSIGVWLSIHTDIKNRKYHIRIGKSDKWLIDRINSGKIKSQDKLTAIARDKDYYSREARLAAIGMLTSDQALSEIVNFCEYPFSSHALQKISDQECLKHIVKTNNGALAVEAVTKISDNHFLEEVVRKKQGNGSVDLAKKALLKIEDPEILAELGFSVYKYHDLDLSRNWLKAMSNAAAQDPEILLKVSSDAQKIIWGTHSDRVLTIGGTHYDSWQSVRAVSSDCHNDHTPWTRAKGGPWDEWGYHGDGSTEVIECGHEDSYPLEAWKEDFLE